MWLSPPSHPDSLMLWAASCVGFFGFLQAGEFTIPSPQSYDSSVHLSLSDLAVDSHTTPSIIRLRIKQSKTDPFRQGVDIFLGATNADICPVQAVLQFLAVRNPSPGPLYSNRGTHLPRPHWSPISGPHFKRLVYLTGLTAVTASELERPLQLRSAG